MALMTNMLRRRKLDKLIASWVQYRDMVARHAGQTEPTPEQEKEFLELKADIAARIPVLHEFTAGQGTMNQELQGQVRGMTDLMNRYLSLNVNGRFDDREREEFMTRWHTHYLYLNGFKGMHGHTAHQPRSRLNVAPASGSSPYSTWGGRRLVSGIFDNWLTRFVVRAAIIVVAVVVVARLINFDFANAGQSAKRLYAEWWGPQGTTQTSSIPATQAATKKAAGAVDASMTAAQQGVDKAPAKKTSTSTPIVIGPGSENRPKYHVDGTGAFTPPQGVNPLNKAVTFIRDITPRPLRQFMRPVTDQWGVEATVAMVGVGLLLVAYMLFGRAR